MKQITDLKEIEKQKNEMNKSTTIFIILGGIFTFISCLFFINETNYGMFCFVLGTFLLQAFIVSHMDKRYWDTKYTLMKLKEDNKWK